MREASPSPAPAGEGRGEGHGRSPLPHRVEVSFVAGPPTNQVERASGVSEVEIDGSVLRCVVLGSFQPFLEALRGHEVISLASTPITH